MSTIAEKARAEAARAESEPETDEEQHELEQEEEPEQPEQPEQPEPAEPTEAMFRQAQAENAKHHGRLHKIMGRFIDGFVECDACGGSGLTLPKPAGPQLEHDPAAATCSVCKGHGELVTGSLNPPFATRQCANCNGQGWVGPDNLNAVQAAQAAVASVGAPQPAAAPGAPAVAGPQVPGEDPRAAELRAMGYAVIAPVVQ